MSKRKVWFYHFAIVKYDKTVALHMLTMIEPYLSSGPLALLIFVFWPFSSGLIDFCLLALAF